MPTERSKGTWDEGIASRQNKTRIATAVISSTAMLLVGLVAAFLAFPPFQEWVRDWLSDRKIEPLGIEQMSPRVFAYYGEADNLGGFGRLELIFDADTGKPSYDLAYTLPVDQTGYAGLAFQFTKGLNLSGYRAVECIVTFTQPGDVVDLYFKDIAGNFNTMRVANNGADEMLLRYEFTPHSALKNGVEGNYGVS